MTERWLRKSLRRGAKVLDKVTTEEDQLLKGRATKGDQAESGHVKLVHMLKMEKGEPVPLLPNQPVHPVAVEVAREQLQLLQVAEAVQGGEKVAKVLIHVEVDFGCAWTHPHKQLQLLIAHVPGRKAILG